MSQLIKQIKNFKDTNDLAGYQKLVLKELTKEFGGAAAAIHDAGDKSEDVAIAWGNLTENAGGGLVPALRGINVYLTESINGWNRFLSGLDKASSETKNFVTVISHIIPGIGGALTSLQTISNWGNEMDANNKAANAMLDLADATETATDANQAYVPSAEEVEAANKAISDANIAMVGTIQSMQDAEESYAKKSAGFAQDRQEVEQKRVEAFAEGSQTVEEINANYQTSIDAIARQEADLAAERDKQTLQFISNILLQKLEVDGLTTAEFDAFAKQQEAWGLWSADTVAKAQAAWAEADKVAASISAIPDTKVSNITVVHSDVNSNGLPWTTADGGMGPNNPFTTSGGASENPHAGQIYNPATGQWTNSADQGTGFKPLNPMNGPWWDPYNQNSIPTSWQQNYKKFGHADGGSFMIPSSYGNEGFQLGGGDTASGGERLQIIPKGQAGSSEIDYDRMAQAFAQAVRDTLQTLGR
jgi:hypothetical protein